MDERLNTYLRYLVEHEGSDLYLTVAAPPSVKINGQMLPIENQAFTCGEVHQIAQNIMNEGQRAVFAAHPEMNMALAVPGVGRFRVNIFRQRAETGMVIRHIKSVIPSIEELGLPPILKQLCLEKNGLLLFVGGTNTGKSTSLASLMDYRNTHCSGHIISVEDPIEST
jgi:twitching motility protein PilU